MSTKPIPIIAAGKKEVNGRPICDGMRPEFEVIHFMLEENVDSELPALLTEDGTHYERRAVPIGSGEWCNAPVALLLGGAFSAEKVQELREKVARKEVSKGSSRKTMPWLRIDPNLSVNTPGTPAYAVEVIGRFKAQLEKLREEGKLDGKHEGEYVV